MSQRVAVVTGGTRGIGAAISVALRDAGDDPAGVVPEVAERPDGTTD